MLADEFYFAVLIDETGPLIGLLPRLISLRFSYFARHKKKEPTSRDAYYQSGPYRLHLVSANSQRAKSPPTRHNAHF
jgi:hypothetical protein